MWRSKGLQGIDCRVKALGVFTKCSQKAIPLLLRDTDDCINIFYLFFFIFIMNSFIAQFYIVPLLFLSFSSHNSSCSPSFYSTTSSSSHKSTLSPLTSLLYFLPLIYSPRNSVLTSSSITHTSSLSHLTFFFFTLLSTSSYLVLFLPQIH